MEYLNTWNCDLKSYYGYHWNSNKLDNARDKMEKYYTRIKKYINKYKTKNIACRSGVKYNNNEVVFEILDGDNRGKKSWLSSLTGTKWYLHSNLNGDFVVIDFSDKDLNMCMAYQLF